MKKITLTILLILLLTSIVINNYTYAIEQIEGVMGGVSNPTGMGDKKIVKSINTVIGIIQYTGTGISLIVITLLGIKYILASPSEKADVKKNIMPILIGCILLFAAVNIISIVESFTEGANLKGTTSGGDT